MTERTRVGEDIEEEAAGCTLMEDNRVMIPTDLQKEYDLCDTVIDVVVSQGDAAVTVTDAEVDDVGRFTVPSKKARMYGVETGRPVSILIDRVVLR